LDNHSWVGVDRGLFEHLRKVRLQLAAERKVPAYVVLGDATLRELARVRPSALSQLRLVRGIGEQRLQDFGQAFLNAIDDCCGTQGLTRDCQLAPSPQPADATPKVPASSGSARAAFDFFRRHVPIDEVAEKMQRAKSTVYGYFYEFLKHDRITDASPWVRPELIAQIEAALATNTDGRMRTLFEALEGKATYEEIRVVSICRALARSASTS
jgi:ATP-dependent DNA helicase RecQ